MACVHPILTKNYPLHVPCSKCVGCDQGKSIDWAVRCVHEASLYEDNCYITLTYDPLHLPKDGALCYRDFQLFMKRLRKKFGAGIRFFMSGEYGSQYGRPHYHACLFNFDVPDKVQHRNSNSYTSQILSDLWGKGFISFVPSISQASVSYVAKYVMKRDAPAIKLAGLPPQFVRMSNHPGIGSQWFDKYRNEVFRSPDVRSFVVLNGKKYVVPAYYKRKFKSIDLSSSLLFKKKMRRSTFYLTQAEWFDYYADEHPYDTYCKLYLAYRDDPSKLFSTVDGIPYDISRIVKSFKHYLLSSYFIPDEDFKSVDIEDLLPSECPSPLEDFRSWSVYKEHSRDYDPNTLFGNPEYSRRLLAKEAILYNNLSRQTYGAE